MSNNSVQLLGYYGGDERICLSAWQSTNIELDIELGEIQNRIKELFEATVITKKKSPAELLKFLAQHNHGCYDDQTEILTLEGWKLFKDITYTDKVCTVDINTRKCWFEQPIEIHTYDYNDSMYYVETQQIDLAVSKNHRMVVSQKRLSNGSDYGRDWEFQTAQEVSGRSRKYLKSAQIENESKFTPELAQLIGFFIGDGYLESRNRIAFHLRKTRKIEYLKSLSFTVRDRLNETYVIDNLEFDFNQCYSEIREKRLPGNIYEYSKQDVDNILIGLKNSDGSARKRNIEDWTYYTTSNELKQQLLTLSCLHNFVFTERSSSKQKENHKPCHRLGFTKRITPELCNSKSRQLGKDYWKPYFGKVYCVTVSTGAVMVRRNGHTVVSGNSPFEKGILDFQITGDIASHIHAIKHRHSSINCESARYKEINDKYYLPNDWKNISINTEDINLLKLKPQIKDFLIETLQAHKTNYKYTWLEILEEFTKLSHQLYHLSCEQLTPVLGRKRAKESARYFLSYNKQLDYDWQMNFRSFVNIQQLRNSEFAQEEIHYITNTMLYLVETIPNNPFKYSLEAFNLKSDPKYILN